MTLIWRSTRKRTCATMVYALTRYATLAAYIVSIVPLGELPLPVRDIKSPSSSLSDSSSCPRGTPGLPIKVILWSHPANLLSCEAVLWLQIVFTAASYVAAAGEPFLTCFLSYRPPELPQHSQL